MAETTRAIPRFLRRGCTLPPVAALHVGRIGRTPPAGALIRTCRRFGDARVALRMYA
jgi:hypothetical protein